MRALCEGCGKPQPPDWKAGDLCSFCGKAVRHDVRCYWCAKWVPAAKFCRSCGAAVVEERLYGAARMLKDAGTDRFTIPKQLKEFDPDQVENFSRIYQRHAIAVARHVDETRFLERFLRQKHWSSALEDVLIPQLPWNEETLGHMSGPRTPEGDDLATVKAIQESTPFDVTRSLALLVRLLMSDWSAYKDAAMTFHAGDPAIRAEAALALTGWRVWYGYGRPRDNDRKIFEELQKSPFKVEAAVRLGLLGRQDPDLLRDALASSDRDTAFTAALVLGDVERLQGALKGDELERIAAGSKLIALGIIKPVVETVEKSPLEVQKELVESLLSRKEPAPEAADTLMEIVEKTVDDTLRERAARILCRDLRPAWVLRIAKAAKDDRHIFQSLLQAPTLDAEGAAGLGDLLIQKGFFRMSQYGLSSIAENGRMHPSFVPKRFAKADEKTQPELLRFAEVQLEHHPHEGLHAFIMGVVFGAHPAEIRKDAWWTLHRWYRQQGEHRGEGPFKLQKAPIERFFGSVAAFLPKLAAVLRDHATMKEVGYYEMMANLLNSADDATVAAIQEEESAADDLVAALLEAVKGDYWPNTVEAMIKLVSQIGGHPRWRDRALKGLRSLGKTGNYYYDKALRRLELSSHGIPEESEWDKLPMDFAATRYAAADDAGRRELLKLVDHQLIHKKTDEPDPALRRVLLDAVLRGGDLELRGEALGIYADRMRPDTFPLRKKAVEESYGPFSEFLPLATATLKDKAAMKDPRFLSFFAGLLDDPQPADVKAVAAEGEEGLAFVQALLDFAGAKPGETRQVNVRRDALRYLEKLGAQRKFHDEILQGLERLGAKKGFDLASEAARILEQLRPVAPPKPAYQRPAPHPKEDGEPAPETHPTVVDYAERGRIAQQMGLELQAAIFKLMSGDATPEQKMKEATRMSEEYQAKIKELYK